MLFFQVPFHEVPRFATCPVPPLLKVGGHSRPRPAGRLASQGILRCGTQLSTPSAGLNILTDAKPEGSASNVADALLDQPHVSQLL